MASVHSALLPRPSSLRELRAPFSDSHEAFLPQGASGAIFRFAQRDTGIISPPFDRRIQCARLKYKATDKVQSGARLSTGRSSSRPPSKLRFHTIYRTNVSVLSGHLPDQVQLCAGHKDVIPATVAPFEGRRPPQGSMNHPVASRTGTDILLSAPLLGPRRGSPRPEAPRVRGTRRQECPSSSSWSTMSAWPAQAA